MQTAQYESYLYWNKGKKKNYCVRQCNDLGTDAIKKSCILMNHIHLCFFQVTLKVHLRQQIISIISLEQNHVYNELLRTEAVQKKISFVPYYYFSMFLKIILHVY